MKIHKPGLAGTGLAIFLFGCIGALNDKSKDGINAFVILTIIAAALVYTSTKPKKKKEITDSLPNRRNFTDIQTFIEPNKKEHTPPPPTGNALELLSGLTRKIEAVGEQYREVAYRELFKKEIAKGKPWSGEVNGDLILTRDPNNKYDKNAIAVWCQGLHIGYMPAEDAALFAPMFDKIGHPIKVEGRVWANEGEWSDKFRARTYFYFVNFPEELEFVGQEPREGEVLIPKGSKIQVLGEDLHMDVLRPLVSAEHTTQMWVRLEKSVDFRPKSARDRIDIFFEGQRIGWLSDIQTKNVLPIVDFIEKTGRKAVAIAVLNGSKLKAEVVLHMSKAEGIDDAWLESLGGIAEPRRRPDFDWDD